MIDYNSLTDLELADLLKSGDRLAYSAIYQRYKGLLYIHAYKRLENQEAADDVVHDLFAVLWDKRETLDITGHLSGYLYTAIRNRIFKLIARNNIAFNYIASIRLSVNEGYCITDHTIREKLLKELIEKEVSALPKKMREVFELSRKANLSHRQIAEHLDISEATVKKHIHHALKILRVKLGILIYVMYLFNS